MPLPEDPTLAAYAAVLNEKGHWATVFDAQWRVAFVTDELRLSHGEQPDSAVQRLGEHDFGPSELSRRKAIFSGDCGVVALPLHRRAPCRPRIARFDKCLHAQRRPFAAASPRRPRGEPSEMGKWRSNLRKSSSHDHRMPDRRAWRIERGAAAGASALFRLGLELERQTADQREDMLRAAGGAGFGRA